MNKLAAAKWANDMTKSFIEHQAIASPKADATARGKDWGESITSMHSHLTAYFQKVDDDE